MATAQAVWAHKGLLLAPLCPATAVEVFDYTILLISSLTLLPVAPGHQLENPGATCCWRWVASLWPLLLWTFLVGWWSSCSCWWSPLSLLVVFEGVFDGGDVFLPLVVFLVVFRENLLVVTFLLVLFLFFFFAAVFLGVFDWVDLFAGPLLGDLPALCDDGHRRDTASGYASRAPFPHRDC